MRINRIITLCIGIMLISQQAQGKQMQSFLDYIEKYNKIAVQEMKAHGIPASITLAQGLLESGAGMSQLSKESNNHFGIKCHDWKGDRVYFDDDEKGECFRKYKDPKDSYDDHSLFLVGRPRYASLFQLKTTDYKGWAKGLKRCGYATDPNYANRLIGIIEEYGLNKYDKEIKNPSKNDKNESENQGEQKNDKTAKDKAAANYKLKSTMGAVDISNTHTAFKKDGKRVVIAQANDTYESIAKEFGLKNWEIRWYNKVKKGATPEEGSTIIIKKW